jgi:hypothetical protein
MDITPSANGLSVYMPPGNQVSVGQDALINNKSTHALTILKSDGSALGSVPAGLSAYFYLTDNSTVGGTWQELGFGATTSVANANTLAGYGLLAISNTLNQTCATQGVISGQTFNETNRAAAQVWNGGNGFAILPSANTLSSGWFILFKNNGTGSFTINCSGTDVIDTLSDKVFQPNESAFIVNTGSGYITIGYGASANFLFTAITKSVTSGNYTLTTPEATSVIQEYVGSLTGNVVVTYPPVIALYVISNQVTANGHSLTITTGVSGGSTATVPAGNQSTVICDGKNFFNANTVQSGASVTSLTDGSPSNPSLNFASETNTGLYRAGTGVLGITILGTNIVDVTTTGIGVAGILNATGGIFGGTY